MAESKDAESKDSGGTDADRAGRGADQQSVIAEVEATAAVSDEALRGRMAESKDAESKDAESKDNGGTHGDRAGWHADQPSVIAEGEAAAAASASDEALTLRDRIAETVDSLAGKIVEDVRGAAAQLFDDQKTRAAEAARGLAGALRRTAESLGDENAPVAQIADRLAERVDAASTRLRERDWSQLAADTEELAHRQPALFMAGAVGLGFVLGRMLAPSATRGVGATVERGDA
jgi:hypothetical protein